MFTLLSFAAHLGAIEADLKLAGEGIIAKWCMAVRDNASRRDRYLLADGFMHSPREPSPAATRTGFITATAKRCETLGGR
jgi:hypothetical protein